MTPVLADLPDDIATVKALVVATASENTELGALNESAEVRIARLNAIRKALERARFARRSERLLDDQIDFVFDEVETGLGHIEAELDRPPRRGREPRPRKVLPAHLDRVELVIEPPVLACACGTCEWVKIGEDVSERLDVMPARFRVIVTRRPRYACTICHGSVVLPETRKV